jgi:hypothetical protein
MENTKLRTFKIMQIKFQKVFIIYLKQKKEDTIIKSPLERSYKCRTLRHFPDNLPWNPFDEDAITQVKWNV